MTFVIGTGEGTHYRGVPAFPRLGSMVIEVCGLHRRYGTYEAVRDVSFHVARGELFALLGTNGAGKTSTLEVVEGLARPAAGTVRILGRDPLDRAAVRRKMGVMLQEGGLPPDLTAAETARMWAGTLTDPRPVAEVLALVGLEHRATVRVRQLSGGERRRLDLALAILGRPEVLLLDEPTTGLDPQSRQQTWRLIRDLLVGGATVLLTTHYLQEAEELADRLAILHGGAIVAAGSVAEVVAGHPARVTLALPVGVELPVLPGVRSVDARGVYTDDLQGTVAALLSWAAERGIALTGFDARPATLEEAFLSIASGEPS